MEALRSSNPSRHMCILDRSLSVQKRSHVNSGHIHASFWWLQHVNLGCWNCHRFAGAPETRSCCTGLLSLAITPHGQPFNSSHPANEWHTSQIKQHLCCLIRTTPCWRPLLLQPPRARRSTLRIERRWSPPTLSGPSLLGCSSMNLLRVAFSLRSPSSSHKVALDDRVFV